jgi:limonene-1,2-epoxide hydrolase
MMNRRTFLASAGLAAPAAVAVPALATAADWTDAEKANVAVVNEMCRVWTAPVNFEKVGSFLAEDCVYRATETAPPVKGRQAIVDSLKKMLGAATKAEFEIVQTFARGPMVVNERFDRFALPQRNFEWHGIGVFMLKDGKIAEWNDYTIQMKA